MDNKMVMEIDIKVISVKKVHSPCVCEKKV